MAAGVAPAHPWPAWRFVGLVWLAVFVPLYADAYGLLNFAFLCNLGIVITALALWRGSVLLLSSQAVAAPVIGLVWSADVSARLVLGRHLFGGTAYMWDPQFPLFTRLLSCYHALWAPLVFWLLRRTGYDRRGWALQSALALAAIALGRVAERAANVNFAHADPFFKRDWGGPLPHVLFITFVLAGPVYGLTHALLVRTHRAAARGTPAHAGA